MPWQRADLFVKDNCEKMSQKYRIFATLKRENMAVLGRILKETTKFASQLDARRKNDYSTQIKTLLKLLDKAKFTEFGLHYNFDEISKAVLPHVEFSKRIPITNYDDFHKDWLHRTIAGEQNITWPGKIKYYALSSGTSGAPSKRIPVSDSMIKKIQRVSVNQLLTLHDYDLDTDFYEKSMLMIGGSSALKQTEHFQEGDLSGILTGNVPFWFSKFSKPGKQITDIAHWDEKVAAIVKNAPNWDIGVISGVPAWVSLVLKAIIQEYKLSTIHDLWPALSVYVSGGVSIKPYKEDILKLFGKPVHFQETYLASEGYFAFQKHEHEAGMRLRLQAGVYFEFIPFNDDNFEDGKVKPNCEILPLHLVKEDVDYALVISTCSGLWRYILGDTIRFVSTETCEIIITGRIAHYLSICGEHLSVENMQDALTATAKKLNTSIAEFTVYGEKIGDDVLHHWFIGTHLEVDAQTLSNILDETLSQMNDDYAAVRKRTLKAPIVTQVPEEKFSRYLSEKVQRSGQTKFPRVLKPSQMEDWKAFLER